MARGPPVNIANEQTPLGCSENFRHRVLCRRANAEKIIAAAPPKGSRCLKVGWVVVVDSTLRQLVLELSWPQPNGQPDEPNQIISAASGPSTIGYILVWPWLLSSPFLTGVPPHPPCPAWVPAPPNCLFLSRYLTAADLLQPWARPHGRGTQHVLKATTVAEKTMERAKEEGGRHALFFKSCLGICLSKIHLGCSRKDQEGWSRAACRVGKLGNSLLLKGDGRAGKPAGLQAPVSPATSRERSVSPWGNSRINPKQPLVFRRDNPSAEEERKKNWKNRSLHFGQWKWNLWLGFWEAHLPEQLCLLHNPLLLADNWLTTARQHAGQT